MNGGKTVIKRRHAKRLLIELGLLALAALAAVGAVRYGFDRYYENAYPLKYTSLVDAACEEKNLDRALVYAIIRTESGFNPDAQSNVGARGLMQMMPDAYDWVHMRMGRESELDYEQLYDPAVNVEYGTEMLRLLFDEFETQTNVLCAYHAGWGSVKKWLADSAYAPNGKTVSNIPFEDTAHYVSKVNRAAEVYRRLYQM